MTNVLLKGLPPMHPGEMLREDVLPALGVGKAAFARALAVSRTMLYDILDERRPVSPQMAFRLGKVLGNGPDLWLKMQATYDLAVMAPRMERELADLPVLAAAA